MRSQSLNLANFSGRELNRAGFESSGNWNPPPPAYMTNGLTYGPIYLLTGSHFNVRLGYALDSLLDQVVGEELFDVELFTAADGVNMSSTPCGLYSLG